jgi:hypothetical protein
MMVSLLLSAIPFVERIGKNVKQKLSGKAKEGCENIPLTNSMDLGEVRRGLPCVV